MLVAEETSKHIAVLAFPFATHAAPLLCLVRRLSAPAPDLKFSFFSTAKSNSEIFAKDEVLENIKHYNVADGMPENYVFSGNPQEPVELFLKATPGNFRQAMEAAVNDRGRKITCILSDAFLWFAADMAQELHVPWVALWTAGPCSLLLHIETDLIRRQIGINGSTDKTLDFLPGLSAIRAADAPQGIVSGDLNSAFPAMLHNMGLTLPRAAAVVSNSFAELDPTTVNSLKSRLNKFLDVGPLAIASPLAQIMPDPHGCLHWLDKQKQESVVYISFGSVITPPPHELEALTQALEAGGFPFLWSFRGNPEEKLPKGFLERTKEKGKVVTWTPQLKVLEHKATGVFMTHCGWNSVSDSIIGCVPMICRPFFGDQHLNTRIVEAVWRIGVGIEGGSITKDGAKEALTLVLSTHQGKKMRMELEVLQKLALDAVQSSGSSTTNFKTLVEVVSCHQQSCQI